MNKHDMFLAVDNVNILEDLKSQPVKEENVS